MFERIFLTALFVSLTSCIWWKDSSYHLRRAEDLSQQKLFHEAIEEYRLHMRARFNVQPRPDWENPYLYLLKIGDLQLGMNEPLAALDSYILAEKNKVEPALVSDRFRALAGWYEKQGQLDEAIKLLSQFRSRDPLLFDSMLDRIAKMAVRKEREAKTSAPSTKP